MGALDKIVFGTMSISNKSSSIKLLNFALNNFKVFHLSSEYKSFNLVSKIIKKKKKLI